MRDRESPPPRFIDDQAGGVFRQSMRLGTSLIGALAAINAAVAMPRSRRMRWPAFSRRGRVGGSRRAA